MTVLGKSVFSGIAIGRIAILEHGDNQVKRTKVEDVEAEVARFEAAKETAKVQLQEL